MRQLANPHTTVLSGVDAEAFAEVLHAVAHRVRVEVLSRILTTPGGMTTMDLARAMVMSQPAVSHHMRILTEAGFVQRRAQTLPYTVVPGVLDYVASFLAGGR